MLPTRAIRPDYWHTGVSHCWMPDAEVVRHQFKTPILAERSENSLFRRQSTSQSASWVLHPQIPVMDLFRVDTTVGPRCSEQPCPNAVPHGTHGFVHGRRAVGICLHASVPCCLACAQSQHGSARIGQVDGIDFRSLSGPLFSTFGTSPGTGLHFSYDYIHAFFRLLYERNSTRPRRSSLAR
jgi:hypothetical protein